MRRTVCSVVALAAACALAALVALAIAPAPANAAVMGIDFGSEYIKVASVKPGTPFHIVVDEQSKRKIPSIVAFDNGERHFGNGAVQLALRKPKDTYIWAHRLLGKDINAPQVEELKKAGYAWEIVSLPERGTLGFRHAKAKTEDGADTIFSVEEIVAMSLQHVMKIAEVDAEVPVKDCVLTVPPYWTHRERQALLDAAEIAGLNVLSLINENAAAAVQYGIDRKYTANETHNVMFYNMGSTSTKVNLATYSAYVKKDGRSAKTNKTIGQFEIIGMGYDDTLGGFAFEQRITDYVVKEVNAQLAAKGKTYDVRTNMKAMAKIRAASEKAKTVLSANQESLIFLNSLYEDTDFKMMLQRDAFLTMVDDLVERTTDPIQQALDESGLTLDQIDAVVIIGGGLRIPAVQAKIKSFVQKEHLTQSLNGDEAMVMGAVFRAANLSTTFQVRPFGMIDTTPYAVGVRLTSATAAASTDASDEVVSDVASDASSKAAAFSKRASLFKRLNRLGKKKTVQFTHTDDFDAQLAYEASTKRPALPVGISLPIDHYNITGLARLGENAKYVDLLKDQKPKVSLSFLLDGSGLASLVRAEATLEEMVRVPVVKKKSAKTEEKKTEGDAEAKTDAEKPADDATATDAATNNAEADKTGEETSKEGESEEKKSEDATATTTGEESEPEFTMKKKTHTIPLTVVKTGSPGSVESMNTTHKLMSRATLEKLRRADDMKKEIAASKNALEAHIYATRSQMNEPDIEPVSTEEQREEVRVALAAAEEWLYDQGDESAQIFKDKLAEVKALSDPIFFRLAEVTAFPIALNTTQTLIEFVRKQCIDYAKNRPWVPEADRMKLKNRVEDLAEWLEEQQALQAKVQAHEKPVLESEMLYDRIRPIHKMSNDLMKLKKPIEKAKKKEKKDAKKDKKDATADKDAKDAEATSTDAATDKPAEETAEKTETKSAEETQAQAEATADSTTTEPKDEL